MPKAKRYAVEIVVFYFLIFGVLGCVGECGPQTQKKRWVKTTQITSKQALQPSRHRDSMSKRYRHLDWF